MREKLHSHGIRFRVVVGAGTFVPGLLAVSKSNGMAYAAT